MVVVAVVAVEGGQVAPVVVGPVLVDVGAAVVVAAGARERARMGEITLELPRKPSA
jgi:hypothetical protein